MDNPVVLALVIAGVAALLLVPLVISLVKKNQRREELERRDTPVLEGDGAAEAAEGTDAEAPGETPGESTSDATPDIVTVPAVEQPESIPSRMQRLR
ncbi:signal recognition particle-docking protein FtsY, partial [Actinotignum timonense]|nr:signal recognition particle-docking protein FtsY [Actinotignum timonense]